MPTHDYFGVTYGIRDPQDVAPICWCEWCGRELYDESELYHVGGFWADCIVCEDCALHENEEEP